MTTLLSVVDEGSLSAASRRLGAPIATVSRRISDLERHLRTRLLTRGSRRVTLTEAGASYVAVARRIVEQIDEAERIAAGEYRTPQGHLTVTAPVVFGRMHVEPIALDFLKAYPQIDIRLVLADHVVNLQEDHIDAAVRVGELPDSSLMVMRLGEIGWTTCASPDYLARRGAPARPADLAGHDCIIFEGLYSSSAWHFGEGKQRKVAPVRPRFAVNTAEAAIDAALAGTGITRVLSYQVVEAIRAGRLIPVLRDYAPDLLPVSLVYAAQTPLPLKLRAFIDFAAPRLRSILAGAGVVEARGCA